MLKFRVGDKLVLSLRTFFTFPFKLTLGTSPLTYSAWPAKFSALDPGSVAHESSFL